MNYCTIQDAWGNNNEFSNQYKNYMNNKDNKNNMQVPQTNKSMITDVSSLSVPLNTTNYNNTINPNTVYNINECANFIEHIRTCKDCRAKMRDYFKPKIIEKMNDIIEDNKDIIVLILIGLSILLFFNMINNITK